MICPFHQIFRVLGSIVGDRRGTLHVWERTGTHTEFWWANLEERDHLKDLSTDGTIILKWILKVNCNDVNWINLAYDRNW